MVVRALGKMVVGNVLATAALRTPDAPALYCSATNRRFTFREVDDRANRLAGALTKLGLRKGDVVAFLCSNRAETVEIYFALARTGVIGLPMNYRLAVTELVASVRAIGASALVFEARFRSMAQLLLGELPSVRHAVVCGDGDGGSALDYETLLADAPPEAPDVEIDETDPFYFNLTSGTTGLPKSYLLTHYNNCTSAPLLQALDMTNRDVVMTVFPIFGRVGFGWVLASITLGVPNVLANFEPAEVLRLVEAERVTMVNLVPTMAAMLLPVRAASGRDLRSLRAIVFAGASLPGTIREQSAANLCSGIYEYYGMNEMGPLAASGPPQRAARPDSVGKPLTFCEMAVVAEDGRRLGPNEIGEILGRSPMTVGSYHGDPEKSADTFRGGWVHTGDLGYTDAEGFLFLRGRKKDMIVTGGQNVYAAEVEDVILRHPGVGECAVIGLPDALWGERVTAVVVPRGDAAAPTAAELEAFCRAYLAGFKTPKTFILEAEPLPRTPTAKVQKFLLVARFGGAASA